MSGLINSDYEYLRRLISAWGFVADFYFGDLVLLTPRDSRELRSTCGSGTSPEAPAHSQAQSPQSEFQVVAQIRPTTWQTLYLDDLVGTWVDETQRPELLGILDKTDPFEVESTAHRSRAKVLVRYIPVRRYVGDTLVTIAFLCAERSIDRSRKPGRIERVYHEVFDAITKMITTGHFPFHADDALYDQDQDLARVGDGVIVVDWNKKVRYCSPNATSALHRLGLVTNGEGRRFDSLGIHFRPIETSFTQGSCARGEIEVTTRRVTSGLNSPLQNSASEHNDRVCVNLLSIPLLAPAPGGTHDGARVEGVVVLIRDVTEVRRRDRILVSKDVTIREIHHRVKNNLQTVSSLLRLAARRTEFVQAREALEESVRRVGAIALVHETLSQGGPDFVDFDDLLRPLLNLVAQGLAVEQHVPIEVKGIIGLVPTHVATPLALSLTELVQNCLEHARPKDPETELSIVIEMSTHRNNTDAINTATIAVTDNGPGFDPGFDIAQTKTLGLSIVNALITTELEGSVEIGARNCPSCVELVVSF